MDGPTFDALARFLAVRPSRRQFARALAGGLAAATLGFVGREQLTAAACPSGVVCSAQCCPNAGDICLAGRCTSCPSGVICSAECCAAGETCQAGRCAAPATGGGCAELDVACGPGAACCAGLVCGTDGTCERRLGSGGGCGGDFADCSSDSDCCAGYACSQGSCFECSGAGGPCDPLNGLLPCCNGLTCSSSGTCLCRNSGQSCRVDGDCCGTLVCGSGGTCVAGSVGGPCASTADCTRGLTCCSGICVDLQSDPKNCSRCGFTCGTVPGGSPVCVGGSCGISCGSGFSLCSSGAGNYCCTKCCPTKGGTVCC